MNTDPKAAADCKCEPEHGFAWHPDCPVHQPKAAADKAQAYGDDDQCVQIGGLAFTVNISATKVSDAINASITAAREKADAEMLRVKACEHIAEGDEGWEQLSNLCQSTAAVAKLREQLAAAKAALEAIKELSGPRSEAKRIAYAALAKVKEGK